MLANEQVVDGLCERCGTAVIKKNLAQWFFKITDYADRLLDDIEKLEHWPSRVRTMQRTGSVAPRAPHSASISTEAAAARSMSSQPDPTQSSE